MLPRLLFLFALFAATPAGAAGPTAIPVEQVADSYVRPQRLVEVEHGRKMNLYCKGTGSPTVVFDSGLSDWSNTWALIQPAVATRTRACSYDRAGMGYSDSASHRPTPTNVVRDLHTLLEKADIQGPLVLVGHSLGGFNMKLYAATYPEQVAGIVLVDPSEERLWPRVGPLLTPRFGEALVRDASADDQSGIKEGIAHFQSCASTAKKGALDDVRYTKCTDPVRVQLGSAINAERRRLQRGAAYQTTQADEFAYSMFAPDTEADARYARLFSGTHPFGSKPLVVLTHSIWDMTPPFGEISWMSWVTAHQQTAAMSTQGTQRVVPQSRHNIQVDHPQVVIDAIAEVLDGLNTTVAADVAPAHQTLTLQSGVLGETRRINVYLPPEYDTHTKIRYPVLYMPDGGLDEDFPHVAATADRLIRAGEARPFLIIGVENTVRRRDMTGPTQAPDDLKVTSEPGGASRFRSFLRNELMPEVQKRYRVSDENAIIGESLAGLFIVETLMVEPALFDTYIALDPSLWWNKAGLTRDAKSNLAQFGNRSVRLFLSSGGPQSNSAEVEALANELVRSAPAKLQWSYLRRPDLRHDNIYRAMEETMLREAFAPTSNSEHSSNKR